MLITGCSVIWQEIERRDRFLRDVCFAFLLLFVLASSAGAVVWYHSNGFESPQFSLGALDGQDNWVGDVYNPIGSDPALGTSAPTVVNAPNGIGGGQVMELAVGPSWTCRAVGSR